VSDRRIDGVPRSRCRWLALAVVIAACGVACGDDGGTWVPDATGDVGASDAGAGDAGGLPTDASLCDDEGTVVVGRTTGLVVGSCGVASREFTADARVGLSVVVDAAAPVRVRIVADDGAAAFEADVDPDATFDGGVALDAGTWRIEVTGDEGASAALTLVDACAEAPTPLVIGEPVDAELAVGDCLAPDETDRFVLTRSVPSRLQLEVTTDAFEPALSVVGADGGVVGSGGPTLDLAVPAGTWAVEVSGGLGAYAVRASIVDPCAPTDVSVPGIVGGTFDDDDCADTASLRTTDLAFDTDALVLVRAEVAVRDPGIDPAEVVNELTNNGLASTFVRMTARTESAAAVARVGVLDPGPHLWTVGRLFDGAVPAPGSGVPWVATLSLVPEPHCTRHLDLRPLVDPERGAASTRRGQTAWDCAIDGRWPAVWIQSVTFTEATFYSVSVFIERSGTAQVEFVAPDGRVLDSGFAIGDQLGVATAQARPGTYWVIVRLESPDDPFTVAF